MILFDFNKEREYLIRFALSEMKISHCTGHNQAERNLFAGPDSA